MLDTFTLDTFSRCIGQDFQIATPENVHPGLRLASDARVGLERYRLELRERDDLALSAAALRWLPQLVRGLLARRWFRLLARPARPLYRRLRARLAPRA